MVVWCGKLFFGEAEDGRRVMILALGWFLRGFEIVG